jgi:hypothetical protein
MAVPVPTLMRQLLSLPLLLAAFAGPQVTSVRPVGCQYVRVDQRDAVNPAAFVIRLKRDLVGELAASGSLPVGYPKPCRWKTASEGVSQCFPDSLLSLDSTDSIRLDEAGYALTLRVIDFPSPMHFSAEIYLVPTGSVQALPSDRDSRFWRVQILGGFCDDSMHRAIVAAGALPLDD